MLIGPEDWAVIESGVRQRAQLLEAIMADVYTSQRLIAQGLLPQELVQGHPGYLRCLQGTEPVGQTHLRIAAFDLARSPQGHWWVVSQRTQAPSGQRLPRSRWRAQAHRAAHAGALQRDLF